MLDIQIDSRQIMARLSYMPDKLRAAFLKKTYALAEKLKSKVQQNLTNKLLHIRSGNLVRSIFQQVTNDTNEVSGRVYSSGLPYARIQEFGGQTRAHIIEAKNAKALMLGSNFAGGSTKGIFFKRVHHPGSKIKGAHYMGTAFKEMTPEIKSGYEQAAAEGTK
jgi:phage gpG-like protein